MKNPWPLFNPLTQAPPDWIHLDVLCFGRFLMMITQAMIEKVELPLDFVIPRKVPFPITDGPPHTRFTRERNDAMQMVRH
jgi:hypothetical protein